MRNLPLPVLYIRGPSGKGKTTLIEKLTSDLTGKYKLVVIKSSRKGFDVSGKDTDRLFRAGPYMVIGISREQMLLRFKEDPERILRKILEGLDADLVIVEGMKGALGPNIALSRDFVDDYTITIYNGKNYSEVLENVIRVIEIGKIFKRLPGLNCGRCGYDCWRLAEKVYSGENVECVVLKEKKDLEVYINGKSFPLNPFVRRLLKKLLIAFLRELKGYEGGSITIRLEDRNKVIYEER